MTAKMLANLSVELWLECRRRGFKSSVKLSSHAREGSLSRYLFCEGFTIRISDHPHRNVENFDHQVIITANDAYPVKRAEAMRVLEQLLGGPSAVVA